MNNSKCPDCEHDINSHTFSEDYTGCYLCKCSFSLGEYIAALEKRLEEAEEVIKLQDDVVKRWFVFEKPFGQQELEKRFGENEFPESSIYCDEWLERVLRIPTAEATGRAALWLKGGEK